MSIMARSGQADAQLANAARGGDGPVLPAGPSRWLLRASDLSFTYPNGLHAVGPLDLELRQHEVLSIVGPSGCGKSTLLSLLAALREPTHGRVEWNEELTQDSRGRRPTRRRLTLVFQRDTVLPWRTVEQNVAFGLKYLSLSREEKEERVDSLLKLARIDDFRKAFPNQLSGGMRRRVALLTGVAPLPHVVILDEPFAALDEPTRVNIHADLLDIIYRLGLTVVLVTHDLGEAISIGDRVMVVTRRPARCASLVDTEIGRPRDVRTVRERKGYQELYASTWHEVWKQSEAEPSS